MMYASARTETRFALAVPARSQSASGRRRRTVRFASRMAAKSRASSPRLRVSKRDVLTYSPSSNAGSDVWSLYEDRSGLVWIDS